jgi:hypothetical protein
MSTDTRDHWMGRVVSCCKDFPRFCKDMYELLFLLLPSTSGQEGAVLQYPSDQREGGVLEWSKWSVCDNPKWIGVKEIEMDNLQMC